MDVKISGRAKAAAAIACLALPLFFFNNCQKFSSSKGASGSLALSSSIVSEERALLDVLNKSVSQSGVLLNLEEALEAKESSLNSQQKATYAKLREELKVAAADLSRIKGKILTLLNVERLAYSHNLVLQQVDFLILALSEARSLQLEIELRTEIGRVESESIARDQALSAEIDNLEAEFAEFKNDVALFKQQVNAKFSSLDDQIAAANSRLDLLNTLINQYNATSIAADEALAAALNDLKVHTETQVVELREKNAKLKQDILAQKEVLGELFKAEEGVASLAGRLCSTEPNGEVSPGQTKCSGNEANLYSGATCCLSIEDVDCSILFSSEVQVSARNQCNILVSTVKNHGEQLKAIKAVDEKQTELISGLLDDVENLNDQVSILEENVSLIQDVLSALVDKVQAIDKRLLIVEFKAARSEAAAAIFERTDLNMAWIARRSADISARFCHAGVTNSLNQFDYEAARQNWHYCREKLEFLTRAQELTQLARAYTNGLSSVNVDSTCSATINGKSAEELSNDEITDPQIFQQIIEKCTTGGPVLARALMYNVVQLLSAVGPDFRTVQYMAKKAKIGQLLFLGKPVNETTTQERAQFENVDPTHADIANTLYGRIERPFKNRYVENRMRTLAGTFPERPSDIPEVIPSFNHVWKLSEINSGTAEGNAFFKRLAALEVEGSCGDCGFAVASRTITDVVINRDGKSRFSYPKDTESLCPVINDVVVLKHSDGKHYPYYLNYNHMREDFKPVLRNGSHVALANSDADVANGNFAYCGRHGDYLVNRNGLGVAQLKSRLMLTVTRPWGATYAGRGACVHTAVVCVMRGQEWQAPSGSTDLISYLNGYSNSVVQNKCTYNIGGASAPRVRQLEAYEKNRIRTYPGVSDQASANLRALVSPSTSQLTSKYWTLKDNVLNYGVNNQPVSISKPFLGSPSHSSSSVAATGHTDPLIRAHHALTQNVAVQECSPYGP